MVPPKPGIVIHANPTGPLEFSKWPTNATPPQGMWKADHGQKETD
jgi:hypothetical protein